ncbi:ArsR/SmtB family transcription factor [Flexilinea flocculi]|jgi:ArsR family transcriptional regulator|uniref:DNA-binding transcriptional regulator, ArsR family n=1 Tax=Flexilinea flocculi TaxID=1678840 RepID=A0A0K8PAQ1_9CHLR|nr:metalloregulator ArsR/SmtB family transcription factor [Flexilinea flocculi]GAP39728.1 DNA-binding transcriptional regulator, ArsR family [Flexilinea flocculi]
MIEEIYIEKSKILKAIADPKRLKIITMISNSELCACKILEEFQITQPTLSHDMKVLCDAGVVRARKEGKWMHYSLNTDCIHDFKNFLNAIICTNSDSEC